MDNNNNPIDLTSRQLNFKERTNLYFNVKAMERMLEDDRERKERYRTGKRTVIDDVLLLFGFIIVTAGVLMIIAALLFY